MILGNGDGTFQPPVEVVGNDTYGAFGGIVAGDFNKDGNLDFAVLWLVGDDPVQAGHLPERRAWVTSRSTTLTRLEPQSFMCLARSRLST